MSFMWPVSEQDLESDNIAYVQTLHLYVGELFTDQQIHTGPDVLFLG